MSILLICQQEAAALAAPADCFRAAPYRLGMQIAVACVVTVAEGTGDLRAAIPKAGLIVGAFHDIESCFIAMALRKFVAMLKFLVDGFVDRSSRFGIATLIAVTCPARAVG